MRRSFFFALCWVALLFSLPSHSALAANDKVSQTELTAQKELLQTQIEALKSLHQKDADAINKRIDDQLAQVGQGVDRFGVIAAVLGTLVSLLLAGLGLIGYVTVNKKTKVEAEQAAQDWFDANEQNLKQRLGDVDKLAADVQQKMLAAQYGVDQQAQDVYDAMDRMQANIGKESLDPTGDDALDMSADTRVVQARAQQLEKTPESSYSFEDWNTRGHAAYSKNAFDEAAYLWLKASQIPNAGAAKVAQVLYNRGVVQGQLGQSEEAIKTCNELLRRFGDASELALKEQVVKALVNKGVTQGQLGQNEEAIKTYDEVLRRFGDASELALRGVVAKALVNKGITQGQLGQNEEEIKTYDEVLRRFGDASEPALKESVAQALNGMGFFYLIQAKAQWADRDAANALLHKAQDLLSQAISKMPQSFGMALGNRAYAHWLLGNFTEAETDLAAGLRAEKFAGQDLYEGMLKDFDIHPIREDQGMREMVERLWVAYQHGKTGEGNHG